MLHRNLCETCGGTLKKVDDSYYVCEYCTAEYSIEKVENYVDKMKELLDDAKLEMISNAKKNLYRAVTDKFISSAEVCKWCDEVKKYLPDDFQANFYDDFVNKEKRVVAKNIRKIDVEAHFECLEALINFLIRSLELEFVNDTMFLIERAYKKVDLEKYNKYSTMVSIEAEKLDDCIYDTSYPRDVFVAYSSIDTSKAFELVEVLEEQGLSCFISIRNLRQGSGSKENYDTALKDAMDNCTSFVFVSSMNSRNSNCDALRIEMRYIKNQDRQRATAYSNKDYSDIPSQYKKPRVEYRLEESTRALAADRIVDDFFAGYQRVYTPFDVAERILMQSVDGGFMESGTQITTQLDIAKLVEEQIKAQREAEKRREEEEKRRAEEKRREEERKKAEALKLKQEEEKRKREEQERLRREEEERKRKAEEERRRKEEEEERIKRKAEEERRRKEEEERRRESTSGLEFKLNPDEQTYKLVSLGTCKADEIVVDKYNGKLVTSISESVFYGSAQNLKSVTIGRGVTNIPNSSFNYFNITKITIDDGVQSIGKETFYNCENLLQVNLPDSVTSIGKEAFWNCEKLESVFLGSGLTQIEKGVFMYCTALKNIIIPDNVESIGANAFSGCTNLGYVVIGKNVKKIARNAFSGCKKLRVYGFDNIPDIRTDMFSVAPKYQYSETKPQNMSTKLYWHYVDGVPTEW